MPDNTESIQKLGEIIFNGAILVFTISFGLFPFALEKASTSMLGNSWFSIALFVVLACGVSSLILSFVGILKGSKGKGWIIASLISLLVMVGLLCVIYIQIFSYIIKQIQAISH